MIDLPTGNFRIFHRSMPEYEIQISGNPSSKYVFYVQMQSAGTCTDFEYTLNQSDETFETTIKTIFSFGKRALEEKALYERELLKSRGVKHVIQ